MASVSPSTARELRTERRLRVGLRLALFVVLVVVVAVAWRSRTSSDQVPTERWSGRTDGLRPVDATTRAGRLRSFSSALSVRCRGGSAEVLDLHLARSEFRQSGTYAYAFAHRRLRSGATVTASVSVLLGAAVTGNLHAVGGDGLGPAAATCTGDTSFRLTKN